MANFDWTDYEGLDNVFVNVDDLEDTPEANITVEEYDVQLIDRDDDQESNVEPINKIVEDTSYWHNMEFATLHEAREIYACYAHRKGFGWRVDYEKKVNSKKQRTERAHYMKYVCNKEGFRRNSDLDPNKKSTPTSHVEALPSKEHNRCEERTGCKTHVKMKLNTERNVYVITGWREYHNHVLVPQEFAHMLRSNRKVTDVHAVVAEQNDAAGITLRSSYDVMAMGAGGNETLSFLRTDLKNHLTRKRQKAMQDGEGTALMEYFRSEAYKSPEFFYEVEVDSEEKIANISWADSRMKLDYACFGDIVAFDTTYRTNKNYRPLAVFSGFNHHRMGCVFGAALLYDETIESFQWLFKTFLRCMSDKAPNSIFTDQDSAMASTIRSTLPQTFHGLCTWHIMQNAQRNLRPEVFKKVESELNFLMYDMDAEKHFDYCWERFVNQYFPDGSPSWIKRTYGFRTQWSSAWVKDHFTAGMRSIQLAESVNASCNRYLQPDHNLSQFFGHFERVVAQKRNAEKEQDFHALDKMPNNHFIYSPLLRSAAAVYTPNIFARFQKEYRNILKYQFSVEMPMDVGYTRAYRVYKIEDETEIDSRIVMIDPEEVSMSCSCRLFENEGLLCRHIMKIMD